MTHLNFGHEEPTQNQDYIVASGLKVGQVEKRMSLAAGDVQTPENVPFKSE